MRVLEIILLSVLACASLSRASLLKGSKEAQLRIYKAQIVIVDELLASECSAYKHLKRESEDYTSTVLEIQKKHLERLTRELIKCREEKLTQGSITNTTTTTVSMSTTTTGSTTTSAPLPAECVTATNFTESWRLDHDGGKIHPGGPHSGSDGDACDTYKAFWFRFTGEAGTRLLNTCPKPYSCGSRAAVWSDAALPQPVGASASINLYGSFSNGCKTFTFTALAMRCSWTTDHDVIYKYTDSNHSGNGCGVVFCGMN